MPQGHPGQHTWRTPDAEELFARHLRALREKAGLTQQQVADQMRLRGFEMHRSAIAKVEASEPANRRPVRVNEAVALADVLGVPVADLVVDPNAQRKHANLKRRAAEEELQAARMTLTALTYEAAERQREADRAAALLHDAEQRLHAAMADLAAAEHRLAESRQVKPEE